MNVNPINRKSIQQKEEQTKSRLIWAGKIILFAVSAVATGLIIGFEHQPGVGSHEFLIGEPAPRTLFSPLEFSYVNEKQTEI